MEVVTNGTIEPEVAVKEAARVLRDFFAQVVEPKEVVTEEEVGQKSDDPVLKLTVEELDLPVRIANALRRSGLVTAADLVAVSKADLVKVKNLGEKSLEMIIEVLSKKGLRLKEG
jgi:DNA-directed RNA polymerase subunit alpha